MNRAFRAKFEAMTVAPPPKAEPPYIKPNGDLIIPFASDPKYHHWNGGQAQIITLAELQAPRVTWMRYALLDGDLDLGGGCRSCGRVLLPACGGAILFCHACGRWKDAGQ